MVDSGTSSAGLVSELRSTLIDVIAPTLTGKDVALLDFPNHGNVGDSAIWLGELELIGKVLGKKPAYVCTHRNCDLDYLERFDGTILLHGGGNFGDLWPVFQNFRERVLRRFGGRQVIQLPQTIHFSSQTRLDAMRSLVGQHGAFTLLVRDEQSLKIAQTFDCESRLAPDSAFMLDLARTAPPVHDVIYLRRQDKERGSAPEPRPGWREVDWVTETAPDWRAKKRAAIVSELVRGKFSRHRIRETVYEQLAQERLSRGVDLLCSGREVITDRLHAHILSTLLNIPHHVLDNSYGKLSGFVETWETTRPGSPGKAFQR